MRVGEGARLSIVEVFAGPHGAVRSLVVPVTEPAAADAAVVSYVSLQILGDAAWSIGRLAARGTADSTVRTFTVGLALPTTWFGLTSRSRVVTPGSEILSTFLGDGTQVHDIRTLHDHVAPRTASELLCQGAVAGTSRLVDSGLIRVHRGAVRSDARQTNLNSSSTRGRMPTQCRTSTSSRTTSVARTPRRWDRPMKTSAITLSPGAWHPRWLKGSSCAASSTPSSTDHPFPNRCRSCRARSTNVSTWRSAAKPFPPVSRPWRSRAR